MRWEPIIEVTQIKGDGEAHPYLSPEDEFADYENFSDGRKIGPDGRCGTPVGDTVDLATATYTNTIGDAILAAHWKDPDFDPEQDAFYYIRVLEIPTPRWTTYDAVFFGIDRPDNVPATLQDRAYTSPIWYTP